ncbi:MAG: cache domain-containing protein [Leptospirillia bacterium]
MTLVREIHDLDAWSQRNPLPEVAATLLDRIDTQLNNARATLRSVASDPALLPPSPGAEAAHFDALSTYAPLIQASPFMALMWSRGDDHASLPQPLPDGWEAVAGQAPEDGIAPISVLPDGREVLAIGTPLAAAGRLVGLYGVEAGLDRALVRRMQLAEWGQAFLADETGRIFLSAHPELKGKNLADLGLLSAPGESLEGRWKDASGTEFFTAVAGNPGWYDGPQKGWKVGLAVRATAVADRAAGYQFWVAVIVSLILLITLGLGWVLRTSIRGKKR